jgi:hypothetical protein
MRTTTCKSDRKGYLCPISAQKIFKCWIFSKRYSLVLGTLLCFLPCLAYSQENNSGQIARLECIPNPFNPSQLTKAKVYSAASVYSSTIYEGCGVKMKVLEIDGNWAKVEDMEGKITGYSAITNLTLPQEKQPVVETETKLEKQKPSQPEKVISESPPQDFPSDVKKVNSSEKNDLFFKPEEKDLKNKQIENNTGESKDDQTSQTVKPETPVQDKIVSKKTDSHEKNHLKAGSRCGSLYEKMSLGKILNKNEADFLLHNCN